MTSPIFPVGPLWVRLALAAGLAGGCGGLPPTVDIIEGTWAGALVDGDLDSSVVLYDRRSMMGLEFYVVRGITEEQLWLDLTLDGDLELLGGAPVDGLEITTFEGVYLDGTSWEARSRLDGIRLRVRGEFSDDFQSVQADVRFVGEVPLQRVADPAEVELVPGSSTGG